MSTTSLDPLLVILFDDNMLSIYAYGADGLLHFHNENGSLRWTDIVSVLRSLTDARRLWSGSRCAVILHDDGAP